MSTSGISSVFEIEMEQTGLLEFYIWLRQVQLLWPFMDQEASNQR